MAPIILVAATGATLSRIFVGAHYFSDCLAGFVLGCLFCAMGSLLNRAVDASCASCASAGACYAATKAQWLSLSDLASLNLLSLFVVALIACAMIGLAMSTPLLFWQKCLPIFGLLAPTFAFRVTLLCPQHNAKGVALFRMENPSAPMVLAALLVTAAALLFAKLVNTLTRRKDARIAGQLSAPEAELTVGDSSLNGGSSGLNGSSRSGGGGGSLLVEEDDDLDGGNSAVPLDASQRLLLQCTSIKAMMLNLLLFLIVYAAIFISLAAWRISYATPAAEQHVDP